MDAETLAGTLPFEPVVSRFAKDKLLGSLLRDFAQDLGGELADLAAATGRGDWAEARRIGHKLKGEAATFGYPDLATLAGKVETVAAGQTADKGDLSDLVRRLKIMAGQVLAGLEASGPS